MPRFYQQNSYFTNGYGGVYNNAGFYGGRHYGSGYNYSGYYNPWQRGAEGSNFFYSRFGGNLFAGANSQYTYANPYQSVSVFQGIREWFSRFLNRFFVSESTQVRVTPQPGAYASLPQSGAYTSLLQDYTPAISLPYTDVSTVPVSGYKPASSPVVPDSSAPAIE